MIQILRLAVLIPFINFFLVIPIINGQDYVERRILQFFEIQEESLVDMKLEKPSFIIPLLELRDSLITVTFNNFQIPGTTDSVGVKFFFSKEGEFFRMESLNKMEEDLWRLSIESLERDMKFGTETILGVGKVENDFQFNSFWTEVCKELSIQDAEEFNMTLLKYKFHNGEVENIIIMNIWGLANPLGISVDIPDLAKNRIRAFFDLKGILVAADNRL